MLLFFFVGGFRAASRHVGPAHLGSPGPGPESPLERGDFAGPRQAEERWSRLDRRPVTSRPWLLQEAGGILSLDVTVPLESQKPLLDQLLLIQKVYA